MSTGSSMSCDSSCSEPRADDLIQPTDHPGLLGGPHGAAHSRDGAASSAHDGSAAVPEGGRPSVRVGGLSGERHVGPSRTTGHPDPAHVRATGYAAGPDTDVAKAGVCGNALPIEGDA